MRRLLVSSSLLAVVSFAGADARAQTAGINMGAPVWNGVVANDALSAAVETGAAHVRVNFRIDKWTSPTDPGFFAAYDQIVGAITSQGMEVYGLLNDELSSNEDDWVLFATAIIDHYKDRVRVWETINEPNDWAGGTSARFPASKFARWHERLYDETKGAHAGDECWNVRLVTGPLFSFDGNSSASYFDDVLAAWSGRVPFDDVGYHVYVAQGADSSEADVGQSAGANLDAIAAVLAKHGIAGKRIWISEIGFRASALGDEGQATRLDTTFAALGARADVASVQWFTVGDFGSDDSWGLFRAGGFGAAQKRASFTHFVAQAKAHAPELAAKLTIELPKQIAIGANVVAKVTATNLGKKTWTAADGSVRLGAASGCPSAWSVNAWAWKPAPPDGYAKSVTDARRFLPANASVAQGDTIVFEVPLEPATATGKQHFAVRMVDEGVAWFGATASADVDVVPASVGAGGEEPGGSGATSPGEPKTGVPEGSAAALAKPQGCGCRTAGDDSGARGVAFGLVLAIGALVHRRRGATRT